MFSERSTNSRKRDLPKIEWKDAFYDNRGRTFPLNCFLNDGAPSTKNRRDANIVSKNDFFVSLGHGIIHWNTILLISAEVSFRVRYGVPKARGPRKKNGAPLLYHAS